MLSLGPELETHSHSRQKSRELDSFWILGYFTSSAIGIFGLISLAIENLDRDVKLVTVSGHDLYNQVMVLFLAVICPSDDDMQKKKRALLVLLIMASPMWIAPFALINSPFYDWLRELFLEILQICQGIWM